MVDAVLMIGGGVQEAPAVDMIHSLGYMSIVTDRDVNAPALKVADYLIVCDGRDVEGIAHGVLALKHLNVVAVFTLTELVTTVSAIGNILGLPVASLKSAVMAQDKSQCKYQWSESRVPTARFVVLWRKLGICGFFEKLGSDVIVKPAIGFGARGITRVQNREDLLPAYHLAKKHSDAVIMEEYLEGSHHDVNGIFFEDTFYPLYIGDRYFTDSFVEEQMDIPTLLDEDQQHQLYEVFDIGCRAIELDKGPVKGDMVLTKEGPKLLEVAPRLHGPKGTLCAALMAGMNPLRSAILALAGKEPISPLVSSNHCLIKALLPPSGEQALGYAFIQGKDQQACLQAWNNQKGVHDEAFVGHS